MYNPIQIKDATQIIIIQQPHNYIIITVQIINQTYKENPPNRLRHDPDLHKTQQTHPEPTFITLYRARQKQM